MPRGQGLTGRRRLPRPPGPEQGIAPTAQAHPKHRCGHRAERRHASCLTEGGRDIRQEAASGGDRIRAPDDERHLAENRHTRVERRKRQQSRAHLVRRQYLPTGEGQLRPLGLPAVEAQRRPRAGTRRRQAIYAQDCLCGRAGDRPPGGAWAAVARRPLKRQGGRETVVVEAASQGGWDNRAQGWVVRRVEERREEGALWQRIKPWLKAGGLDPAGPVLQPATGPPQGGSRSPIRAKGDWHEALALGCPHVVPPRGRGAACLRRDAADVVCAGAPQADAARFDRERGQRRGTFGLARAAGKRRGSPFPRQQGRGHTSFALLGVAWRWGRARAGKPPLKRRPSRQPLRAALTRVTDWGKERGRRRLQAVVREVNAKWRGDSHDDGVNGTAASLPACVTWVRRSRCNGLTRRRQRRSSPGTGVRDLVHHCRGERPPIVGRPPTRGARGRAEAGRRKRVLLKRPGRAHRTPGSVRGRSGTWPSYRDLAAQIERVRALEREMGRILVPLFPHLNGRFRDERIQDFKKAWKVACEKAGCPGMLWHDFRRTAVKNMVNVGVTERVAMKVTGPKTRSVFDRYHIVSPADLQEVARKLTGTISGTIGQTVLDANNATL